MPDGRHEHSAGERSSVRRLTFIHRRVADPDLEFRHVEHALAWRRAVPLAGARAATDPAGRGAGRAHAQRAAGARPVARRAQRGATRREASPRPGPVPQPGLTGSRARTAPEGAGTRRGRRAADPPAVGQRTADLAGRTRRIPGALQAASGSRAFPDAARRRAADRVAAGGRRPGATGAPEQDETQTGDADPKDPALPAPKRGAGGRGGTRRRAQFMEDPLRGGRKLAARGASSSSGSSSTKFEL